MRTTILLLTWALAAPALAAPPAPTPEAEQLLGAIDVLMTPELVKQTKLTEAWATAVLDDTKAKRYLRTRAIGALALHGTDSARARIERAAAEDADVEVRIQAVVSLARAFGPGDRDAVEAKLKAIAEGAPDALRAAVVRELTRLDKPPAR